MLVTEEMDVPLDMLMDWLLHESAEMRRRAAKLLPRHDDPRVPELLVLRLGDSDWRVRKEATLSAALVRPRERMVAVLVDALRNRDDTALRNATVESLSQIGVEVLEPIRQALSTFDADARKLVAEVVAQFTDRRAVDILFEFLSDEDVNVRIAAAEGLGIAGSRPATYSSASDIADRLTKILSSSDPPLLLAAMTSLEAICRATDCVLAWDVAAPHLRHPFLRRTALSLLVHVEDPRAGAEIVEAIGGGAEPSREALVVLASWIRQRVKRDSAATWQDSIRRALVSSGSVEWIRRLRAEPERATRQAAILVGGLVADSEETSELADSLAGMDAEVASLALSLAPKPLLLELADRVDRFDVDVRAALIAWLSAHLGPTPEVQKMLEKCLEDRAPTVAEAALAEVGRLGGSSALERVFRLVAEDDHAPASISTQVLSQLAEGAPERAMNLLASCAWEGRSAIAGCSVAAGAGLDPSWRRECVRALGRCVSNRDPQARRMAVECIGDLGATERLADVELALVDENDRVRKAAAEALGKLGAVEPLERVLSGPWSDLNLVEAALWALLELDEARAYQHARSHLNQGRDVALLVLEMAAGRPRTRAAASLFGELSGHADPDVRRAVSQFLPDSLVPEEETPSLRGGTR